jgi:hypothetical protein
MIMVGLRDNEVALEWMSPFFKAKRGKVDQERGESSVPRPLAPILPKPRFLSICESTNSRLGRNRSLTRIEISSSFCFYQTFIVELLYHEISYLLVLLSLVVKSFLAVILGFSFNSNLHLILDWR